MHPKGVLRVGPWLIPKCFQSLGWGGFGLKREQEVSLHVLDDDSGGSIARC